MAKRLTFTFDDGLTQDRRLIDIFNRYGLKGTFHLCSGLLGTSWDSGGVLVSAVCADEVPKLYEGHEVAAHTVSHPFLPELSPEEVIYQVESDRVALEKLVGYPVVGFAYPGGGMNADDGVIEAVRKYTNVQYARSNQMSHDFSLSEDRYFVKASVHTWDFERMLAMGQAFLELPAESPAVFNVMGHSVELDVLQKWDAFEAFCERLAGRADVTYVTNREIYV